MTETQNCQGESDVGRKKARDREIHFRRNRDAVWLELLPRAQKILGVLPRGSHISFKVADQVFQRKSGNSVESLPGGNFQRIARNLPAETADKTPVITVSTVVISRRGSI